MTNCVSTVATVSRISTSALTIAQWLKTQPIATDKYYAGLPEHPAYALSKKQAAGFGAMISFKVTSAALAQECLCRLKLIFFAESLGGVESLITHPLAQTHADLPREVCERVGINNRLLRLSVGIEDADDLIRDLEALL